MMIRLTKTMRAVLEKADIERGEISDVPMSTMYGLETRKLISADWRKGKASQTTGGRAFPSFNRVKLTAAGVRAARSIQGLSANI